MTHSKSFYEVTPQTIELPFETTGYNLVKKDYNFLTNTDTYLVIDKKPYIKSKHDTYKGIYFIPDTMNEPLARLIGMLVANGCYGTNNVQFSSGQENLQKQFTTRVCNLFGKKSFIMTTSTVPTNIIGCKEIMHFFTKSIFNGKFTARYKKIPEIILNSNKEVIRNFLCGLLDCDSYLERNTTLVFSSASKDVSEQVHKLLLGFGVVGVRGYRDNVKGFEGHKYWEIRISGKYFYTLHENVLKDSLTYKTPTKVKVNTNIDIIPNLMEYLHKELTNIKTTLKIRKNGTYLKQDDTIGRFKIGKYCKTDLRREVTYEFLDKMLEGWETLPTDQRLLVKDLEYLCKGLISDKIFFDKLN